jgi:hypothetical protein
VKWEAALKTASSFPILLSFGLFIRIPALFQPVQEGQRNAQTATLTAGMIEDGHLRLDPIAPWRGDLDARLVQELPAYNFSVLALTELTGFSIDFAGRLASLIFWLMGFLLLQKVWRIGLPEPALPWANLLFVFAPMNWYLSTAFMPETLLQTLTIGFLFLALQYSKNPQWTNGMALAVVGAFGMLVKLPAFVHLGLFLALIVLDRQNWRAFFHPVLLLGACLLVGALLAWSNFIETVNSTYFPYWTGKQNLLGFVQPGYERWGSTFWIKLLGYNLAYVLPLMAALPAAWGARTAWSLRHTSREGRIWLYLLASLFLSWMVWGKGAAAQNYYNLPNLICFCAFFGLGMVRLQARLPFFNSPRWIQACFCIFLVSGVVWCGTGLWYLSRPDTITLQVADWVEQNTAKSSLILYQPRHSSAVLDYEHQPLLSHATGRRTWIWTRSTPEWEKLRALQTSSYAIVTNAQEKIGLMESLRRRFKGTPSLPPESIAQTWRNNLETVFGNDTFCVYKVRHESFAKP